jgi:hypothetical protein
MEASVLLEWHIWSSALALVLLAFTHLWVEKSSLSTKELFVGVVLVSLPVINWIVIATCTHYHITTRWQGFWEFKIWKGRK